MSSKDLHIVVLGAGESGIGAAMLAKKQGYSVFVSDKKTAKPAVQQKLEELELQFEFGGHTDEKVLAADIIVKSPGIPDTAMIVLSAKAKGIEIISEIEFGYRHCNKPIIAITGSNGKTTTTLLVNHMLEKAGLKSGLSGNIGNSMAKLIAEGEDCDYLVLELSSFQLDGIVEFRPDIAILLNITPDHLDRYNGEMANYRRSKMRICMNQTAEDAFIYCADDEEIAEGMAECPTEAKKYAFSLIPHAKEGGYVAENQIIINQNLDLFTMSINELALQGKHNLYNSMAAGISGSLVGLRKEVIRESLSDFQSVEHRLEPVISVHGISFINDSKATNVNATWYALESVREPIIWIVGGVDKGNDYSQLEALVKAKVKAIVCLGEDNERIISAFGHLVDIVIESSSMAEAVHGAYTVGKKGDAVLLSPCCASFDLFESYEDRGRQFKENVYSL